MDDAYGDPRNYDPNEDDPYAYQGSQAPPPPATPQWNQWGIPPNGNNRAGYQDLSYWISRGVNPDQIFDANGQTQAGWARTGQGYSQTGASAAPPQTNDPYGPTIPTGGDYHLPGGPKPAGDPYSYGGGFPRPEYPGYQSAPGFSYDPYTASSWVDAENEPGYMASRENLRKQVEAGAAYRGVVRSGATIGDIYKNLDALGQQNFSQFDDRRFRNWSGNMGLEKTKHDYVVSDIDRANNYRFNIADAAAKDSLERWKAQVASITSLARPVE